MTFPRCILLGTIILLIALLPVENVSAARGRGGGHSYPSSHRGLSGSSSSHGYPTSGGLSGNNGGSRGRSPQNHGYPPSSGSSGSHSYPGSHGLSGNSNGYPGGKGLSGNTHTNTHTTINNHYHYSPPQQIRYTPAHGAPPMNYPVYRGSPPNYVYKYQNSDSKYGTLLAGLALLNLGTLAAGTAYAVSHSGHGSGSGSGSSYQTQPGEICKFGIKKDNGDYEETKIDCQLISSFIFQAEHEKSQNGGTNTTIVTTTVTNVTMVNSTNGGIEPAPSTTAAPNVYYSMLANGTLVPVNLTSINVIANATSPETAVANGVSSSVSVTTTTTNTTVTNALDVKGKPIDVTPGMQCYVIRNTPVSRMKKSVPCGLLQTYAEKSLKKNSAARNMPVFTMLAVLSAAILAY